MLVIIVLGYNIFYYNFWLHEFHKVVQNCKLTILFSIASRHKKIHISNFGVIFDYKEY